MLPVLLSLGPLKLYGYGLMITLGAVVSARVLWLRRAGIGLANDDSYWALINVAALSGFFGGKLLFLLQYGFTGGVNLMNGYSAYGGFVSVPLALAAFARWKKIPVLRLFDYMFPCALLWHAFGRIGCFLAGCCYGRPTEMPWGVVFRDTRSMIPPELIGVHLHPVQLYESAADFAIAWSLFRLQRAVEERKLRPGLVAAGHFAGYGVLRFSLEFVRGDDLPFWGPLSQGQALGLGLLAGAAGLLYWRSRCYPSS